MGTIESEGRDSPDRRKPLPRLAPLQGAGACGPGRGDFEHWGPRALYPSLHLEETSAQPLQSGKLRLREAGGLDQGDPVGGRAGDVTPQALH